MTKVKRCNWNNGVWGEVGEQANTLAYWVKEGKISIPKNTERKAKTEEICSAWESLLKKHTECLFRTPAQFLLSCVHASPTTRAMTTPSTDEYLQHAFSILSPLASSELCSHRSYSSSISHHVRTQDVLAHLSAQSIPIDWRPKASNISIVTFATEDWNSWE